MAATPNVADRMPTYIPKDLSQKIANRTEDRPKQSRTAGRTLYVRFRLRMGA